jgi:hypothetical protein
MKPKVRYDVQEHVTCPYIQPDHSNLLYHSISWRSISVSFAHLRLDLPSGLLLIFPHQNTENTYLFLHTCHMACPPHSYRFYHLNNIWQVVEYNLFIQMLRINTVVKNARENAAKNGRLYNYFRYTNRWIYGWDDKKTILCAEWQQTCYSWCQVTEDNKSSNLPVFLKA